MSYVYEHPGKGELVELYEQYYKPLHQPVGTKSFEGELPYLEVPPGSFKLNEQYCKTPLSLRVVELGNSPSEDRKHSIERKYPHLLYNNLYQRLSLDDELPKKNYSHLINNSFVSYDSIEEEIIFLNGARSNEFEIHVELNKFFPYQVMKEVFYCFSQASKILGVSSQQFSLLSSYIKASSFFDACGYILRNSHPIEIERQLEKYHPIRSFESLLGGEQIVQQFKALEEFRLLSEGPIHILNCNFLFHQFLFFGLCLDSGSELYEFVDVQHYHKENSRTILFAGEYSSYIILRKLIVKLLKILQERQIEYYKKRDITTRRRNSHQGNLDEKVISPPFRRNSDIVIPTDFTVQSFDKANPFSIISNIPKESIYYNQMKTLCMAYSINLKAAQKLYPNDWSSAIQHFHPEFDPILFSHVLGVDIIPSNINGNYMLREYLNFKNRYDEVKHQLDHFKNKDLICNDLTINQFIIDKKFIMKSTREVIVNLTPQTEAILLAKYGETSYITMNTLSNYEPCMTN